jgi:hypothetical protein
LFGNAWIGHFLLESGRQQLLEKLGFLWILSCETGLFNGLQGKTRKDFFFAAFASLWCCAARPEVGAARLSMHAG